MDEIKYERILAWLENAMSPSERAAFEAEMRSDPALAKEVKLARAALQAPHEKEVLVLRRQLDEIMSSEPLPSGNPSRLGGKVLVAILLLLALVLLFFFFQKNQNTPQPKPIGPVAAFEKYFAQPDPTLQLTTVYEGQREETDEDAWRKETMRLVSEVNRAFSTDDPERFLSTIEKIKSSDSILVHIPKTSLLLFEGLALLHSGQPEAAIGIFDEIRKIRYHEQAEWYKTGALLALGRTPEATSILQEIAKSTTHPKRAVAKKLIEEISE